MPGSVALVLNPVARHAAAARRHVESACADAGLPPPTVLETTVDHPGGPQASAAVAQGHDRVVVAGGDGTVREVAGTLRDRAILGVVPAGTANLLARGLRLGRDLSAAAGVAVTGAPRRTDLGTALLTDPTGETTEHPFLVVVGLGHDADTIAALHPRLKERLGWLAYFEPGLRRLARPGRPVALSLDGETARTEELWSVLAVNSARLPIGARLVPTARPDDGLLHVVLVAPRGLDDWVRVARTGLSGRHISHPSLRYRQGRELTVRPSAPALVQVDGDVVADIVSARITLHPGALRIAVPTARNRIP